MGVEYAAGIMQVVDISFNLSLQIAAFMQEVKNSNETRSDLYIQVEIFQDTIRSVHRAFAEREEQRKSRAVNVIEAEICEAVANILVRCQGYVEKFKKKIESLGGQSADAGLLNRTLLQLKLQVKGEAIRKLERQITASISSLETLLACFQPLMHKELHDGIEMSHRHHSEILNRIARQEHLLLQLQKFSRQTHPFQPAEASQPPSQRQQTSGAQTLIADLGDPDDEACELVDETLSAARLFLERISEPGTVIEIPTAGEGQIRRDDALTRSVGQSEYHALGLNGTEGGVRLSKCSYQEDETEEAFDCVDSVDIMTEHVDNCKSLAETALEEGNFMEAEKHMTAAIEIGEQRERAWGFPFHEGLECRELLAFSMIQNHNFTHANQIYATLLESRQVRSEPETCGKLHFSLARSHHQEYHHQIRETGEKDQSLLKESEYHGRLAYQSAERLAMQGRDNGESSWPKRHPSLGRAAELLEQLYESWDKPGLALTYRSRKGSRSKSQNSTSIPAKSPPPQHPTALPPTPPETDLAVSHTRSGGSSTSAISGSNASLSPTTSWRLTVPIKKKDYEMTKLALDLYSDSVDIEQLDEDTKMTPLLLAASKKDTRIVRLLLNQANMPNIMAKDPNGWTVLHHAIFGAKRGDMIELLIRAGADVNTITTDMYKMSPLHFAARENNLVATKALLDHQADIEATDSAGRTSLELAITCKRYEVCRLLIRRHAAFDRPRMVKAYPKMEHIFREMEAEGKLEPSLPLSPKPTDFSESTAKRPSIGCYNTWPPIPLQRMHKLFRVRRTPSAT